MVTLHTTLSVYTPKPTGAWVWAVVLQSIAIFAVPIFFMISGMNLLGYRRRESTAQFMRKRCWKIGKALVLGSIVCYVVFCLFPYSFFGAEQYVGTGGMIDFCRRFMSNHINDVYWFLYSIIYLYVLTPILSLAVGNKRCLQYMLALCGLVGVLVPLANRLGVNPMYTGTVFNWPLFSTVPLLYFLAGYYLHTYWRPIRHQAAIAAAAYVAATIGMAVRDLRTMRTLSASRRRSAWCRPARCSCCSNPARLGSRLVRFRRSVCLARWPVPRWVSTCSTSCSSIGRVLASWRC